MPRIGPEPGSHNAPTVGWIGFETGKLPIANGLEEEADAPEQQPQDICPRPQWRTCAELDDKQGRGNDPDQYSLQERKW